MSNAVVLGTFDDEEVISSPPSNSEPSNFLFVNETSDAPSYRPGKRHDIRAHVRKHNSEQFRQTHKTARQRATTRPKYTLLAARSPESGASCHLEPNRDFPTPEITLRFSNRDLGFLSKASALIELNESLYSTTPRSVIAETPGPSENQTDLTTYCKACGQPLSRPKLKQRYLSKDGSLIPVTSMWKILLKPSPVEALGAGRVDPFSSLPLDKPSRSSLELIDHVVTCFLPGLMPDDVAPSEVDRLSQAWFASGLRTPLLFHALISVGSNHLDFMRWSNVFSNAPEPLSHKLIVIQKLSQALSDPRQASRDEIILVILILASEVFINKKGNSSPFNSPLRNLIWLNMYGNLKPVPQHAKALADIIRMRGGLETVDLYGLAEIIVGRVELSSLIVLCWFLTVVRGDIISSTNSLAKPSFPPLRIHAASIPSLKVWAISPPRPPIQTLASAFQSLKEYGITESMLEVLDSIGAFTLAVDYYLQGNPFGLKLGAVARTRTAVQQRLLLLPTAEELGIPLSSSNPKPNPNIYECCRLTALIYSVAVVLPLPNSHSVLQELVRRITVVMEILDIRIFGVELEGVLLWMLVLGGIAALDTPQRDWFTSRLAWAVRKLDRDDWEGVEDILRSFLWLDSACGQGGRLLWREAMAASYSHYLEQR